MNELTSLFDLYVHPSLNISCRISSKISLYKSARYEETTVMMTKCYKQVKEKSVGTRFIRDVLIFRSISVKLLQSRNE